MLLLVDGLHLYTICTMAALTAVDQYDSQLETKLEVKHAQAARYIHDIRVSKAIIFYR